MKIAYEIRYNIFRFKRAKVTKFVEFEEDWGEGYGPRNHEGASFVFDAFSTAGGLRIFAEGGEGSYCCLFGCLGFC